MIKLINNITQIIILLRCCAILIFTLSIAIAFAKNDFATITNIYNYIYMLNVSLNVLKYIKHNKNKFPLTSTL